MIQADVLAATELTPELRSRWLEIRETARIFDSPFLHPDFTIAAAGVWSRIQIGVLREGARVVGFFPFRRHRFGVARPVAGRLSDYQGIVMDPDTEWDAVDVISKCGLNHYCFDHMIDQGPFTSHATMRDSSPVMDLSRGYEHFRSTGCKRMSARLKGIDRKKRKLARELGPPDFEFASSDPQALETVIQWKRSQCQQTGTKDYFGDPANRAFVKTLHATDSTGFGGVLSVLKVNGDVAAAHFGIRSSTTLHWWFPVYNQAFSAHSPGGILLLELARNSPSIGLDIIDLGRGDDSYKSSFKDHDVPLLEGHISTSPVIASGLRIYESATHLLHRSARKLKQFRGHILKSK